MPEAVISDVPATGDVPFDEAVDIGDAEYARIMRRITVDDGADTRVSAFNSSI